MDVFFTADTHFDHYNIIDYEKRPFTCPLEMTEVLIENWNRVVKPNDLIFHMGDVFICKTKRMYEIAERLNGRKILISGNHDKAISRGKFQKLGFDSYKYYFFDAYLLSHHPQHEAPLRAAIGEKLLRGNVHGHVHSQIQNYDQSIYKCVSVELSDYAPLHLDDIHAHFNKKR